MYSLRRQFSDKMNKYIVLLFIFQWFCLILPLVLFINIAFDTPKQYKYETDEHIKAPETFYVKTDVCEIPKEQTYTDDLPAIYKPIKPMSCANDTDIVRAQYDAQNEHYVLHLANEMNDTQIECSYREVKRPSNGRKADKKVKLGKTVKFQYSYIVPTHIESMLVKCYKPHNKGKILQAIGFAFVQKKQQQQQKHQRYKQLQQVGKTQHEVKKPSVIMIGIDSLSRINLRRTMPKLFQYFNKLGWYELQGYNKIGDNTFPNLLAVLTGHTPRLTERMFCDYRQVGCLNEMPFVWRDFKRVGYLTAYAEDAPTISTFNSGKPGFQTSPVDYYLRPFFIATERYLSYVKRFSRHYCTGRQHTRAYIYDYCRDYVAHYITHKPLFGLFWTNDFISSACEAASTFDEDTVQRLTTLGAHGLYEHAIVIFFSDHGARYGKLREMPVGYLDERLPALFIWLPDWFRKRYPHYTKALQDNQNRLTSNFDLYLTLKHIIAIGVGKSRKQRKLPECPRCRSLFVSLPYNRSCADAGIPLHYCTCNRYVPVTAREVSHIIDLVIAAMNDYISLKKLNQHCSNFTLQLINEAYRQQEIAGDWITYRIKYTVEQNEPKYEATVAYNTRTNAIDLDVESISRLNSYSTDSVCISDKVMRKYCVCYTDLSTRRRSARSIF